MKIVNIIGGLGNQMFQYALYKAMKEKNPNEEVKVDISCFKGYGLHNGYELNHVFNLYPNVASIYDLFNAAYPWSCYILWKIGRRYLPKRKTMLIEKNGYVFNHNVFDGKNYIYFDGYWQNEGYFNDIRPSLLDDFSFAPINDDKNLTLLKTIANNPNSISIHVRKGDYDNHPLFGNICNIHYYKSAISYIKSKLGICDFYVFSNDIDWCKTELGLDSSTVYVDWNHEINSFRDMQLMSACKHNIIANSSFSWWAAWLNTNLEKIVIAPKVWVNKKGAGSPVLSSWVII